jgi:hypothetical protein
MKYWEIIADNLSKARFGIFCHNLEMKSPKARTGTAQSQRPVKNRLFEFFARGLRRSRVRAHVRGGR